MNYWTAIVLALLGLAAMLTGILLPAGTASIVLGAVWAQSWIFAWRIARAQQRTYP